jgi:hypothetical protein
MSALVGWLNTAWMLKCRVEHTAFTRSCRQVARTQAQVLKGILRANRDTAFGVAHGFGRIADAKAYQACVPLLTYDDIAPYIARIGSGERNVLTREPVEFLQPTSGTTAGEKLIPYTAGLRRQFQRGVSAWIADLLGRRSALRRGRAYWSISPALGPARRTPGGIPIGFAEDAAYLGRLERCLLHRLLVVPGAVARLSDMTAFRYCTLLYLLAAADLTLISIWNPTLLTVLLAPLPKWIDRLCHDLRTGEVNPPVPMRPDLRSFMRSHVCPDSTRAARLAAIWRAGGTPAEKLRQSWPGLALISCWTDAAAARFVPELTELFPEVEIQPKGLLATEGFVSFPVVDQPGAALALRSHFFEFQETEKTGTSCRLAHELEQGDRYRVILTTGGGLYRYQLRDEVEVVGFISECPLLRFLGKSDLVSDLVGEKLAEPHVRAVLDRLLTVNGVRARFVLLVPVPGQPPHYRLYLQGPGLTGPVARLDDLRRGLDSGLKENPYYRHAVAVGQLGQVDIVILDSASESALQVYERRYLALGQRSSTVKPTVLDRWPGWPELLDQLSLAVG